jgi:MFS family permease
MRHALLPPRGNPRILAFTTLMDAFGTGAYLPVSVLFLTRSIGLTAAQVGIGLTVSALVALVVGTPLGYLADRRGPKGTQLTMLVLLAGCFVALVFVRNFWTYLAVASAIASCDAGARVANGAMIAAAVPPEERVRLRAYLRSVVNGGIAVGTLVGGVPLILDTRTAYMSVILGNAATFLLAAAVLSRGVPVPGVPRAPGQRLLALRDRPYLVFVMVDGLVNSLYIGVLAVAVPLWVVTGTDVPLWIVSALLLINTCGCVALQVWSSHGADTLKGAARIGRRGCLVLGVSCILFGLASGLAVWAAVTLLVAATVVHLLGELWESSASWGLVFGLAPDGAHGQYQGALIMGRQVGGMVSPILLTTLTVGLGAPGWVLLGLLFGACGISVPMTVRWALGRQRSGARNAVTAPGR